MKLYTGQISYYADILQNRKDLPYILFLHGFMGSGMGFSCLTDRLTEFCNPVTLDLAGHGRTSGSEDPKRYITGEQLNDLKSILDRLRLSPLILYGYSMGGRLALQLTVSDPGLMDGMILESTSPGIPDRRERRNRRKLDEERAAAIEQDFPAFLRDWQQKPLFRSGGADTATEYENIMELQNPAYMAACLRGFGSGAMQPVFQQLPSLHVPSLLLAGRGDDKFISIHQRMEAEMPAATSRIVDGASHRVHRDQPGTVLKEIENFINGLNI
ncbi:MAG: alpha/beta fold hydrolase [Balneolaceae bacterium]